MLSMADTRVGRVAGPCEEEVTAQPELRREGASAGQRPERLVTGEGVEETW